MRWLTVMTPDAITDLQRATGRPQVSAPGWAFDTGIVLVGDGSMLGLWRDVF